MRDRGERNTPVDLASITAGVAAVKSGFDTLRTAISLVKDVQGILPEGEKKEAVAASLTEAGRQLRLAEAQIAQGLGYKLCRCEFPPTPMLDIGDFRNAMGLRTRVHECPRCKRTDGPSGWTKTGEQAP